MSASRRTTVAVAGAGVAILAVFGAAAITTAPSAPASDDYQTATLRLRGDVAVVAEVSTTSAARAKGLGQRDSLPDGRGMFFPFSEPGRHGFWMKGMRFSLDFLWIRDGRISEITANVPVPSTPVDLPVYRPSEPVDGMLEVPAGFAERAGLRVGDAIEIPAEALLP